MEQFKQFSIEKQEAVATLRQMETILAGFADLGIDVTPDIDKIAQAIAAVQSDMLRIALLGAFSDGKTSVVAAWLGRVMADMKIDMDESSDRLLTYRPEGLPGECEIVDTPGLFGDKERTIEGKQVMYEDQTKRYISEAHLVFYVVDATNPLKDSHNDIARWVLRDLGKLASTVFVINKMDAVTDLAEPALFEQHAAIKKETLRAKLQRAADLAPEEIARLNIVCIAANPGGRGLDYWFGKPEVWQARSRIGELKTVTSAILKEHAAGTLIAKTGFDVVRDVARQKLALAHAELARMASFEQQNREESERIRQDIASGQAEVKRLARELFHELEAMENQLRGQLRPLSMEDIKPFLEDQIGFVGDDIGYKLHLRIKGAIDGFFSQSSAVTNRISLSIQRQLDSSASFLDAMSDGALRSASDALQGVSKLDPATIKNTIFAARDLLAQVTGVAVKFKPWEASKIAGAVSKWAGPAGAVLSLGSDAWKMYKAHELEQQLAAIKADINNALGDAFKALYDLLADDAKTFAFFAPQLAEFEKIVAGMAGNAEQIRTSRETVERIQAQLGGLLR